MANEVKFNVKLLIDGKEHVVEATADVKELAKELEGAKTGFSTKETWFYRMDMPEGYKHFSKTKPMKSEHCQPIRDWWNDRKEIVDEEIGDEKSRCSTAIFCSP